MISLFLLISSVDLLLANTLQVRKTLRKLRQEMALKATVAEDHTQNFSGGPWAAYWPLRGFIGNTKENHKNTSQRIDSVAILAQDGLKCFEHYLKSLRYTLVEDGMEHEHHGSLGAVVGKG